MRDSLVHGLLARHLGGSLGPSGALKGARDLLWFLRSGVLGRPGRRFNAIFIKSAETYKVNKSILLEKILTASAVFEMLSVPIARSGSLGDSE